MTSGKYNMWFPLRYRILVLAFGFIQATGHAKHIECPAALIVSQQERILHFPVANSNIPQTYGPPSQIATSKGGILGIAVDDVNGLVYWKDLGNIKHTTLNGSSIKVVIKSVKGPMSRAVFDPLEKKLYYTDFNGKTVNVIKLETGEKTKIVKETPERPYGVAVDLTARLLFYGTNKIYKVNLDGSGHTKIAISATRCTYSMDINYKKKRICWVESDVNQIKCSDYFGHHQKVYQTTGKPMAIAVVNNIAYYVQRNPSRITAQELKDGGVRRYLYVGRYNNAVFVNIAVSLGPSGGYDCYPTDMCFHDERLCAYSCDDMDMDGIFVLCEDCRKYLICNGDSHTIHDCPHKPNWGFNVDTRKCQHKSPHCFVCSDPCRNTPCLNGGTCTAVDEDYRCTCARGWGGMECQFNNSVCQSNPCKHGGTCVVDGAVEETLHYKPTFFCHCAVGYRGELCEECVGTFKETRNKGFVGEFYGTPDEDTLADCQQSCVVVYPYCVGVDYKEGKCGMIYKEDEYRAHQLIDKVGNVHSALKPCDSR